MDYKEPKFSPSGVKAVANALSVGGPTKKTVPSKKKTTNVKSSPKKK